MFKPGRPVHPTNGTGTAPNATVTPAGVLVSFMLGPNVSQQKTSQVVVTNREAAQTLEISFANGQDGKWFAIAPATTIVFPVITRDCRLRGSSGGTAAYSIMGVV